MSGIDDILKEYIQDYMTEMFYLEGENKEYYFGISKLNDELTVFYNDIGDGTKNLESSVRSAIWKGIDRFARDYKFGTAGGEDINLSASAFNIPVYSVIKHLTNNDGDMYSIQINYMKTGVLEDAIKNNPERWALYEKIKNKK